MVVHPKRLSRLFDGTKARIVREQREKTEFVAVAKKTTPGRSQSRNAPAGRYFQLVNDDRPFACTDDRPFDSSLGITIEKWTEKTVLARKKDKSPRSEPAIFSAAP